MNCIFRSYPAHPWIPAWALEPRGCGTSFREAHRGHFFQTAETVGRVVPDIDNPDWQLQVPIPQNSRTNLMFNGFCGYYKTRKHDCSAEILNPEAGVLWGRFSGIPEPVLIAGSQPEERNGCQWIDSETLPVLLLVRGAHFCLVTKSRVFKDAEETAEHYLEQDLEEALRTEYTARSGASRFFERMTHHDALAVISAECMMRALRPAEGGLPSIWSQAGPDEAAHLNTNDIHTLTLAWRHLDIETAESLFLGTLRLQGNSGAIPVTYAPHKTFSVLEAPKPLFAKTAEQIWLTRKNPAFLSDCIPLLRRHLQWLLHHFDHKRRGLHRWQNNSEPITPEIYESELATVDLTVLLLTEIEALNRLRAASTEHTGQAPYFPDEYSTLTNNMQTQFWNENSGQYSNAFIRETEVQVSGFPSLTPLLWDQLPAVQKTLLVDQIRTSNSLPGELDVLSWRSITADRHDFPLLQQTLMLQILSTHDPNGSLLQDFTRLILQQLMEWHTRAQDGNQRLEIDPAMAGFILNLMATHHYRDPSEGRVPARILNLFGKMRFSRTDMAIVVITIFSLWVVRLAYDLRSQPRPFEILTTEMSSAYANQDIEATLHNGMQIIDGYPEQATLARLLTANVLMLAGKPGQAIPLYLAVREESPDSPGPMISLGLAYQLQRRFPEADAVYGEFCYLFDEIFPEIVAAIQHFRYCMMEGFKAPPKWAEIYRYQLMHEL